MVPTIIMYILRICIIKIMFTFFKYNILKAGTLINNDKLNTFCTQILSNHIILVVLNIVITINNYQEKNAKVLNATLMFWLDN